MKLLSIFAVVLFFLCDACPSVGLTSPPSLYLEPKETYPIQSIGTDISIGVLKSGDVVVADGSRSLFWKIHPASRSVEAFTPAGLENHFVYPKAICESDDGSLWIASPHSQEVVELAADGIFVQSFGAEALNLKKPIDISCEAHDAILILDSESNVIVKLSPTRREANYIALRGIHQASSVQRMSVGKGGERIVLLDTDHQRLYNIDPLGDSREVSLSSAEADAYRKLESIRFDQNNILFLTDSQGPCILAYSPERQINQRFRLIEHLLIRPTSLVLNGDSLWVADEGKKAILRFRVREASTGLEHALLGEEYFAANFPKDAIAEFEAASIQKYDSSGMRMLWGQAHYTLGEYDLALSQFGKVEEVAPGLPDLYLWKGHAHLAMGMTEEALTDYEKATALAPDNALAHYNLGTTYLTLGQFQGAEAHLTWSLQLDPDNKMAKLGVGRLYLAQKRFAKARDIFASFADSDNIARQAHYFLGLAYLEEGMALEALPYLERSSSEGPFFSESFYSLGNAYRALGQMGKAEGCYKKALEINANNIPAANALKELKQS